MGQSVALETQEKLIESSYEYYKNQTTMEVIPEISQQMASNRTLNQ